MNLFFFLKNSGLELRASQSAAYCFYLQLWLDIKSGAYKDKIPNKGLGKLGGRGKLLNENVTQITS